MPTSLNAQLPASTRRDLCEALAALPDLRPFPDVATRLLAACNDPQTDAQDIARVVSCDPAVTLRLLKVANSSMYGFPGEIVTVDHAIVVLGFRAVRNLVVAAASADLFQSGAADAQLCNQIWRHSLGCAAVSRVLSEVWGEFEPDEAFLASVLHDVGKLVFLDICEQEYLQLMRSACCFSLIDAELQQFGVSHQQVGLSCVRQWGLPSEIHAAVSLHHIPLEDLGAPIPAPSLSQVVALANLLAKAWCLGTPTATAAETAAALTCLQVTLSGAELDDLETRCRTTYDEVCRDCAG